MTMGRVAMTMDSVIMTMGRVAMMVERVIMTNEACHYDGGCVISRNANDEKSYFIVRPFCPSPYDREKSNATIEFSKLGPRKAP